MTVRDLDPLFSRLATSAFRSRFRLAGKDKAYLETRGTAVIRSHSHSSTKINSAASTTIGGVRIRRRERRSMMDHAPAPRISKSLHPGRDSG